MSQQDKPHAEVSLDQVFSRIISEYESGNLEKINLQIDLGLKNPKYEKLEAALKEAIESLSRLTLVGPPSRPTTGLEFAQVALMDNCNLAKQAIERVKEILR